MSYRSSARRALVEAAYRLDLSELACIGELVPLAAAAFDREHSAAFATENGADGTVVTFRAMTSTDESLASTLLRSRDFMPVAVQRGLYRGLPHITTTSAIFGSSRRKQVAIAAGAPEFTALICPIANGLVALGTRDAEPSQLSESERGYWNPVAAHISAAWRLRQALLADFKDEVVFSPEGRVLAESGGEGAAGGPVQALLREAVRRREGLRGQQGDELWPALIAGEWTIVDRFEASGQRVVVAHRNEPTVSDFNILSELERYALLHALDGMANKVIAINLSISESTVSRLVAASLARLRLKSIAEAAAIRASSPTKMKLGHPDSPVEVAAIPLEQRASQLTRDVEVARLTRAERFILAGVLEGRSNGEIASMRKASRRTVANQMAAVFTKLGVNSRRELIARVLL